MTFDIEDARQQMDKIKKFENLFEGELSNFLKEGLSASDCRRRLMPVIDDFVDSRAHGTMPISTLRNLEKLGRL